MQSRSAAVLRESQLSDQYPRFRNSVRPCHLLRQALTFPPLPLHLLARSYNAVSHLHRHRLGISGLFPLGHCRRRALQSQERPDLGRGRQLAGMPRQWNDHGLHIRNIQRNW